MKKIITRSLKKSKTIQISSDRNTSSEEEEEFVEEEELVKETEIQEEQEEEGDQQSTSEIDILTLEKTNNTIKMDFKLSISILKNFNGNPDSLEEFLNSCSLAYELLGEEHNDLLLKVILNKLTNKAAQVVRGRIISNYEDLKTILINNFRKKKDMSSLLVELHSSKQQSGVIEFVNKIENLLYDIIELDTVGEKEEVIQALTKSYQKQGLIIFVNGLKEPLKTIIKSRDYKSLNEAKERALGEELRPPKEYNNKIVKQNKCFKCGKLGHIAPKCTVKNIERNMTVKIEPSTSLTCSICKKKGHVEKDCYFKEPNKGPLTCFKCKKAGHIAKDCNMKEVNMIAEAKNAEDNIEKGSMKVLRANPYQW